MPLTHWALTHVWDCFPVESWDESPLILSANFCWKAPKASWIQLKFKKTGYGYLLSIDLFSMFVSHIYPLFCCQQCVWRLSWNWGLQERQERQRNYHSHTLLLLTRNHGTFITVISFWSGIGNHSKGLVNERIDLHDLRTSLQHLKHSKVSQILSTVWNVSCLHELCCHVGLSKLRRNGLEWMLQRNCRITLWQLQSQSFRLVSPDRLIALTLKRNMLTSSTPLSSRCSKSLAIRDQLVTCLLLAVSVTAAYIHTCTQMY